MEGVAKDLREIATGARSRLPHEDSRSLGLSLAEEAQFGMLVIQAGLTCFANRALAELLGWTVSELIGGSAIEHVVAEDRARVDEQVRLRLAGLAGNPYEIRCRRKDGTVFDARVCGRGIQYNGALADLVTMIDVTETKQALRSAEWAGRMLARTEGLCRSGSFEVDLADGSVALSSGLRELLGLPSQAAANDHLDHLEWVPSEERALVTG